MTAVEEAQYNDDIQDVQDIVNSVPNEFLSISEQAGRIVAYRDKYPLLATEMQTYIDWVITQCNTLSTSLSSQ